MHALSTGRGTENRLNVNLIVKTRIRIHYECIVPIVRQNHTCVRYDVSCESVTFRITFHPLESEVVGPSTKELGRQDVAVGCSICIATHEEHQN